MTPPRSIIIAITVACGSGGAALSACGEGHREPAQVTRDGALLAASGDGLSAVAEVDGVPIYSACVIREARASGSSARAALDRCIEFELLAQEAQKRGLGSHDDVLAMAEKEAVRALLDQQIVAPMPNLEETDRSILADAYKRYRDKIYAPERRQVFHVFAPFAKLRERPGTEDDKRARAFADELYAAVAEMRGLTPDTLLEQVRAVAGERSLGPTDDKSGAFKREVFKVYRDQPNLPRGFSHAALDIPEPGMVSPPARSDYGWHLILYIDGEPAKFASVEQSAEYLFQVVRSERYWSFTGELLKRADVAVAETLLAKMQEREDALLPSGSESNSGAGAAP